MRADRVILAAILGAAAFVRLYRIDLTWYFLDQVRDVSTAAAIASGKSFPLLGPLIGWTSGRLGPLYFYLIAPPFLVSGAPLAGVVFVALAGVLAVFLLHRFAREFFGPSVALSAAALFAVFPLAVVSSRALWNPALVPLFTIVFMRALFRVVAGGQSWAIVGVFGSLAVLTQLHLTSVSLGLVAVLAVLLWRPRLRLAHLLAGSGLFLALYAPYLIHELGHRFENTRALMGVVSAGGDAAGERALVSVLRNLLVLDRRVLDGFVVRQPWPRGFLAAFSALYGVEALLFGIGLALCLAALVRRPRAGEPPEPAGRRSIGPPPLGPVGPV